MLAGEVYAVLGGKFNPGAFNEFDRRMHTSAATMETSEKRINASADRSSAALSKLGHAAKIGAGAGLLALGGTIAYSIKQAADFEAAMRNVNSIAGLSEGQFRKLSGAVKEMAGPTAQSPKVLAEGLYQLVSSGFKAQESIGILHAAAISASAGLTDTATSVTALAGVLNAYHLPASEAANVSDVLFQTVNRGVITFEELAQTLGTVLPFAASLKIPLKDVGASISTLTKEGIPAAEATTYLKNAMVQFLKPSKDLKAAIKETGAVSGEALVKQKGFQGALEAIARTTDGTKGALQKMFPDIRASAAVFALTGANAKTAEGDVKGFADTAGAAQKVFAEQSKSASFQLRDLKANVEQAAITIGTQFLPYITEGAKQLAAFLQHAEQTGQLKNFADGVIHGGQEAVQVLGDIAHVAGEVISPLLAVARALDLGNPQHIEAILAAIAGFKIAQTVAPMVLGLSHAVEGLVIAGRAGALGQVFATLAESANPITGVAVAVGGLAAAMILLGGNESEESRLAEQNAAAHKAQAEAIKSVSDAEHASADAGLAAKQAQLDQKQALETLNKLKRDGKTNTDAYRQAEIDYERAVLRSGDAQKQYTKTLDDQHAKRKALVDTAQKNLDIARKEFEQASRPVPLGGRAAGNITPQQQARNLHDQAVAEQQLVMRTQDYVAAVARANVSDANRQRLMAASKAITADNVQGVSDLVNAIKDLPPAKQAKILVQNQDALAKLGDLTTRLGGIASTKTIRTVIAGAGSAQSALLALTAIAQGVPTRKVLQVLASTGSAKAEIAAVRALIDSLPVSKTTTLTTVHVDRTIGSGAGKRAAGRGSVGAERALVGEGAAPEYAVDPRTGRVRRVTGPTVMDLAPSEYVIPTENRYRGRAIGLLGDLMHDLGIEGYKGGKHPKKHRLVPKPPRDYHVADPDVLSNEIQKLQQLSGEKDKTGKHLAPRALEARRELPAIRAAYRRAHAAANAIQADKERADNAYQALQNADKADNQRAFDRQLKAYGKALQGEEHGLTVIYDALGKAGKRDTKYGRAIYAALLDVQGKRIEAKTLVNQPENQPALEDLEFTKAEKQQLSDLEAALALDQLGTDNAKTLKDAQAKVGLLQQVLGEIQANPAARGGNDAIIDIAGQLKQARDDVTSLQQTPSTSPDLQAQLDQANARAAESAAEAKINAQALAVFQGAGSIAPSTVVVQSLVPPDVQWIRAIGDHATSGQSMQPSRVAPAEKVGL